MHEPSRKVRPPTRPAGPRKRTAALVLVLVASGTVLLAAPPAGAVTGPTRTYASADVPKTLVNAGTVTSTVVVTDDRKVADLDVVDISMDLSEAGDVKVGLTSPSGTTIILWEETCGPTTWDAANTGFDLDDEATSMLGSTCPPGAADYRPSEALAAFDGEEAQGTWTLAVGDATPAPSTGTLLGWGLTFEFPALVVTNAGDGSDTNPADGVCNAGGGTCTFRAAIQQANASAGPDVITFARSMIISPAAPLPTITEPTTIAPDVDVALIGSNAGPGADGLRIAGGGTSLRYFVIESFAGYGIVIAGPGGNRVEDSAIGAATAGNGAGGILVDGSPANVITRTMILANGGDGIRVTGQAAAGNLLTENLVGGIGAPNGGDGIVLHNAPSNTIAGTHLHGGIAGNLGNGVHIVGGAAIGNAVRDSLINANGGNGIFIDEASGNLVEGPATITNHSFGAGVLMQGSGAFDNNVRGATIQFNRNGVVIQNAPANTVGDNGPGLNLISANAQSGVRIVGPDANGNQVLGNYIGTDAAGTSLESNGGDGVLIDGAPGNRVGGIGGPSGRILISGNEGNGVRITGLGATGNQIANAYIGTDVTGSAPLGNALDGVHIDGAPSNLIGGPTGGDRNVISGNGRSGAGDGIEIDGADATGNQVMGNYIGVDSSAAVPLPNPDDGIVINSASNVVGGSDPAEANVISAHFEGILLGAGATQNQVLGNRIGTNGTGAYAIPNRYGIRIVGGFNVIGGAAPGEGNLISGNTFDGISILGPSAIGTEVQGNLIGTDPSGTVDRGNGTGIRVNRGSAAIGSSVAGNLISGNDGPGVVIENGGNGLVVGNRIGTNLSGGTALPNSGDGVAIASSSSVVVGAVLSGAGNVIAHNAGNGVSIRTGTGFAAWNTVRGNAIYENGGGGGAGLGIDLGRDGVTPNDAGDGDGGANDGQNFPTLTSVTTDGTDTTFTGSLGTTAGTSVEIDFYLAGAACDPSGHGEGKRFLGSTSVTTDGTGNAPFQVTLPASLAGGDPVSATATAASGNTSEFGPCVTAQAQPAPRLWVGDVALVEGDAGSQQASFSVRLSAPAAGTVTVGYATANGTATAPADYTAASGTLTFSPGQTAKTVAVTVEGDTADEANETFTLALSAASGAPIADGTGVATIRDNDAPPDLAVGDATVAEGDSGKQQAVFSVRLSAPAAGTVTVGYATANGTATAPADYTAASGTLTFSPGQTAKTVAVTVEGDTADEVNETFTLRLSAPSGATVSDGTGVGSVRDNDPGATNPTLAIGDVVVNEGDGGTQQAVFTVRLSAPATATVSVAYATASGTATAPADYTAASGTLTFSPGQTAKTVAVTVKGDTADESNETFTMKLSGASGAPIADGTGRGTIRDDDPAPDLAVGDVAVAEGDAGTQMVVFTVRLSTPSAGTVTVAYATADTTATGPADYTAASGSLTFAPGQTWKTVAVTVNGDTAVEGNETFRLLLSSPTGATITDGTGVATIRNDD